MLLDKCKVLKKASENLATLNTKSKNQALKEVAKSLKQHEKTILKANQKDVEEAKKSGMKESLIDRLSLDSQRIDSMITGIENLIELADPVWKSNQVWTLENGLTISKMTVPIGVIGIIYESRPNVTVDAFGLALKSGNAILLRGSSSALHSNQALVYAIQEGLKKSEISKDIVALVESKDRSIVKEMLTLNDYIDLIIPRGGSGLIQFVIQNATVPTIETGIGNCHIFVDASCDMKNAIEIIENAKIQRPGVCNACETVLVHKDIAQTFLPQLFERLKGRVEMRGCEAVQKIIKVNQATSKDWEEEYLDYILAIKIVDSLDEAIKHIGKYGTKHSEAILTKNLDHANLFSRKVDAAAVYVNASTRFTDGSEFGFGAEMGISTQKMHARGPMGLAELVTTKYTIMGNGQIRE